MKLTRNYALLATCGESAGSWLTEDYQWILVRNTYNNNWRIYPLVSDLDSELLNPEHFHDGGSMFEDIDPDDPADQALPIVFLRTHGIDGDFSTRRDALKALETALAY